MTKRRIQITESTRSVKAKIIFELKKQIQKAYRRSRKKIESRSRALIIGAVSQSQAVHSILYGRLKGDFGLTDSIASSAVSQIIALIGSNIVVEIDSKPKTVGVIVVKMLPIASSQIANIPAGAYINNGPKGGEIHWLNWLLTKGTQVVVSGYDVERGEFKNSRSGEARMSEGGSFRVNPEYAGTEEDNFITRAIESVSPQIIQIVTEELLKG